MSRGAAGSVVRRRPGGGAVTPPTALITHARTPPPTILKMNINIGQSSARSGSERRFSSRVFCLIPSAILVRATLTPPGTGLLSDPHTWLAAFVPPRRRGRRAGAPRHTLAARLSASYAKMDRVKTSKIVITKLNAAVTEAQRHTTRAFMPVMQEFPSSRVLRDLCKHRNFETFS